MKRKRPSVTVRFFGTRGSVPTPGSSTLRYGGNTSCVCIRQGRDCLILDGGTGIRLAGLDSLGGGRSGIPILISHSHMDHIAGLPFFRPALQRRRLLAIYGPPGLKKSLNRLFPFSILPSRRRIREIRPGTFRVPPFLVSSRWTNHPGGSLAYRITAPSGKTIVYIADHEPTGRHLHGKRGVSDGALALWMRGADLLIMDAQYFEGEYKSRKGWGHSPVSHTVRMALSAGIRRLSLFHHDPSHSDRLLEKKLRLARKILSRVPPGRRPACSLAREGQKIVL